MLEGVANTAVPAIIFDDLTCIGAFKVNVDVGRIGEVEVGTQAKFVPRATQVVLKGLGDLCVRCKRSHGFSFTLEIIEP